MQSGLDVDDGFEQMIVVVLIVVFQLQGFGLGVGNHGLTIGYRVVDVRLVVFVVVVGGGGAMAVR